MSALLIQGGRLIDPSQGIDQCRDVYIENGRIRYEAPAPSVEIETIDARGLIVSPGWIDCHVSFREPGNEEDETIETGAAAALAGGFTAVCSLPDTFPVVDSRASAEFVVRQSERAGKCRVHPLGAVTKGHLGEELAEIGHLVDGGAIGFSDGKRPISNPEIMRRSLQYTSMWNRPILNHAQVPELVHDGVMHEGFHSTVLGLRGIPASAEEIMVRRDIALAEDTGGRVHLMSISSMRSVEEIRQAKARNIHVSADVAPHHLLLTDESLASYDTNLKVNPPFRTEEHRKALIDGLKDGTIAMISSDHQPLAEEKKSLEFDHAPFGISGLETVLPLCCRALIEPKHLSWSDLISKLTVGPANLFEMNSGTLANGAVADVTIIDPNETWTIRAEDFLSKSRNNPFDGETVQGRVKYTIVEGEVRYRQEEVSRLA
ncbi:Dihydroorotase [Thalassoglobus neptunius]|uniref:Dihydroorotase n=1 Tax=Thalassoglobus neptunius TaxID=1938619 RepID=A0A5C5VQ25_9PLAN|nr:dihydroorotase [Thalassoglobus neptunius]TWT40133.1 Dihydroorotase [Thalassoglobus neptunius]